MQTTIKLLDTCDLLINNLDSFPLILQTDLILPAARVKLVASIYCYFYVDVLTSQAVPGLASLMRTRCSIQTITRPIVTEPTAATIEVAQTCDGTGEVEENS